jgi:hypothetical protein
VFLASSLTHTTSREMKENMFKPKVQNMGWHTELCGIYVCVQSKDLESNKEVYCQNTRRRAGSAGGLLVFLLAV